MLETDPKYDCENAASDYMPWFDAFVQVIHACNIARIEKRKHVGNVVWRTGLQVEGYAYGGCCAVPQMPVAAVEPVRDDAQAEA